MNAAYKQSDLGLIPSDWTVTTIAALAEKITVGFVGTMAHLFTPHGIRLLRGQNVLPNKLDLRETKFISPETHKLWSKSALRPGDVVLVRVGYPGTACVIPDDVGPANAASLVVVRPDPKKLSARYLSLFMNSDLGRRRVQSYLVGGAQQVLNTATAGNLTLPLPPRREQEAIAEALSDTDALIESIEHVIAKKRHIKQGALQDLLSARRRLPGFSGDWALSTLGEIAVIEIGRTPPRLNAAYWGAGHKWLSIADMTAKVVYESKEEITELAAATMRRVRKGTLLMSFKLTIGRLCFAGLDLYTNEAICSLSNLKVSAEYLYYILSITDFSLSGSQAAKGYTLNSESLHCLNVPLPPTRSEQEAIAALLSDLDSEIETLEARLEKTRRIKLGMAQALLTGRVRVA